MGVLDDLNAALADPANAWRRMRPNYMSPEDKAAASAALAPAPTSAEALLAAASRGLDLSAYEPGAESDDPLVATSADLMAEWRGTLPTWAQDLDIVAPINPEEDSPNLFVWMRDKRVRKPHFEYAPAEGSANPTHLGEVTKTYETEDVSKAQTITRALNLPYTWDEDEIQEAMETMQAAGLDVQTFDDLTQVWGGLVDRASKIYSLSEGEKKVTPWDVLDMHRREAEASGLLEKAEELDPNRTETMVSRSVQDITEGQAWSVLQRTLSGMLGRDPSDQEIRDYTYRMNQLAASNPSISKTITKYKDGRAVAQSTNSKTGFTGDDMMQDAYEDAQSNPEYAEYQAGTTYYNAALSALGAIGG